MHDEPAISHTYSGINAIPGERTKLHGRIKIILHREWCTIRKSGFLASSVFIDERTRVALFLLESVPIGISLTVELLTFFGTCWRFG